MVAAAVSIESPSSEAKSVPEEAFLVDSDEVRPSCVRSSISKRGIDVVDSSTPWVLAVLAVEEAAEEGKMQQQGPGHEVQDREEEGDEDHAGDQVPQDPQGILQEREMRGGRGNVLLQKSSGKKSQSYFNSILYYVLPGLIFNLSISVG